MKRSMYGAALVAALCLAAAPLQARQPRWVAVGPDGGQIYGLAASPSVRDVVYLGSQRGLFRSADGGASWRPVGGRGFAIRPVLVHPGDAEILHAWRIEEARNRLFRSDDGGRSWTHADAGLESESGPLEISTLVFDPAGAGLLYAATSGGIFASENGGDSWHLYSLPGAIVTSLAIEPGGVRWFAAAYADAEQERQEIFASEDRGTTWAPTGWTGVGRLHDLLAADARSLYALAGTVAFRRLDGGPWIRIEGLPDVFDLAASAERLYAATRHGVFRSSDRGQSWLPRARGAGLQDVRPRDAIGQIAVLAGSPESLLASGGAGVWRSDEGGRNWRAASQGFSFHGIDALAVGPDSTVYASAGVQGVFRSQDRGASWKLRNQGLHLQESRSEGFVILAFATSPAEPGGLYALLCKSNGCRVGSTTDRGLSWQETNPLPFPHLIFQGGITVDPSSFDTVYVIVVEYRGDDAYWILSRSVDRGVTWTRLLADRSGIASLVIDPQDPSILYASTFGGLLKSVDRGATWRRVGRGLPGLSSSESDTLVIDPQNPLRLYIAARGNVYVSDNGGATFRPFSRRGLENVFYSRKLLIDPLEPSRLYLLDQEGIFRWRPEAQRWEELGAGLPDTYMDQLAIDPLRPGVLYAGTDDGGVYRIQLSEP